MSYINVYLARTVLFMYREILSFQPEFYVTMDRIVNSLLKKVTFLKSGAK